jgi:hypothetical protein
MRLAFTWALCSSCLACGESGPCTLSLCGESAEVQLTDQDGNPVAARGQVRDIATEFEIAFDCSSNSQRNVRSLACRDNVVLLAGIIPRPGSIVEVRFGLQDGSISEWQPLSLQLSEHTDPDFNGPGCPCTWYSATVAPVVVPGDAQLALPE